MINSIWIVAKPFLIIIIIDTFYYYHYYCYKQSFTQILPLLRKCMFPFANTPKPVTWILHQNSLFPRQNFQFHFNFKSSTCWPKRVNLSRKHLTLDEAMLFIYNYKLIDTQGNEYLHIVIYTCMHMYVCIYVYDI